MDLSDARRGAGQVTPPMRIGAALVLKDEVCELARHIAHAAALARIAADSPEPEHGAEYLIETLTDLRPRLVALAALIRT